MANEEVFLCHSITQAESRTSHPINFPHTNCAAEGDTALGCAFSGPAFQVTSMHLRVQGFQLWEHSKMQLNISMLNNHL